MRTKNNTVKLRETLNFIELCERLKNTKRHCYTSAGRKEDVAGHTWRAMLTAMVVGGQLNTPVNIGHVLKMLLVHDLPEVLAGDVPAWKQTPANRHSHEKSSLAKLVKKLPAKQASEIQSLWLEFELLKTREARFARAMDKIEGIIQHNQQALNRWVDGELEMTLTYGDELSLTDKTVQEFRKLVRHATMKKIKPRLFKLRSRRP